MSKLRIKASEVLSRIKPSALGEKWKTDDRYDLESGRRWVLVCAPVPLINRMFGPIALEITELAADAESVADGIGRMFADTYRSELSRLAGAAVSDRQMVIALCCERLRVRALRVARDQKSALRTTEQDFETGRRRFGVACREAERMGWLAMVIAGALGEEHGETPVARRLSRAAHDTGDAWT